jgi:hypothetical protein
MGKLLETYFAEAEKIGGMKAKVKLAMLTKLSNKSAADAPDSKENIALFETAMVTVKKECV